MFLSLHQFQRERSLHPESKNIFNVIKSMSEVFKLHVHVHVRVGIHPYVEIYFHGYNVTDLLSLSIWEYT